MSTQEKSDWVDFAALKQNVSFLTILEHYGVLDRFKRKGDTLTGPCPIHKGDSKTAFHVDLAKGVYKCFTRCKALGFRGGGNIIDFVADMEHFGLKADGIKKAADLIVVIVGHNPMPSSQEKTKPQSHKPEAPEENKPLTFTLTLDPAHPYLAERKLTTETIATFGLGYCLRGTMKNRICIPIHDPQGSLVAYAGRAIDSETAEAEGKYRLPANFHKQQVLFNYHRVRAYSTIVLVEGFFDCFLVHQAGFPNVCALMGTALSDLHERLILERFKQVVLMFDSDPAGKQCTRDALNRFYDEIFVRVARPGSAKQPDQLTEGELKDILSFLN